MAHAHAYAKLKRSSPLAPSMTPGCYTPGDTDLSIPAIPPGARWRASESDEHVFRPDTQKRIKVIYESPAVREKCTNAALRINLGREVSDVKGTLLATKGVCTNSGIKKMLDERVKFGAQKGMFIPEEVPALKQFTVALKGLVDTASDLLPSEASGNETAEFYVKWLDQVDKFEARLVENLWAWDRHDAQGDRTLFMALMVWTVSNAQSICEPDINTLVQQLIECQVAAPGSTVAAMKRNKTLDAAAAFAANAKGEKFRGNANANDGGGSGGGGAGGASNGAGNGLKKRKYNSGGSGNNSAAGGNAGGGGTGGSGAAASN